MTIKPKSNKPIVANPGSPEAVFAQMIAGCEALWRETHLESLVTRTIKLLRSNFQIPAFALLRLEPGDASGLDVIHLPIGDVLDFEPQILSELIAQLKQIDLKSYDYTEGINHLEVQGHGINFALLGDPLHEWYGLTWEDLPAFENEDDQVQRSLHTSAEIAVDFLVKQLQTTCRWFSRFTETQTLLHIDDLTGLYNLRYLELSLEREIKRAQRYNSSFCLLFIDLDDFKPINDQHGHLAGSQVLREVGLILKQTVRDVDLVFRYGGDEFVVLLIESDAKAGFKTAQRIRERIQQTNFEVAGQGSTPNRYAQVTSSIGVAAFPEHGLEKDRLLSMADECMYESKRNGKNRVVLVGANQNAATPVVNEDSQIWLQK